MNLFLEPGAWLAVIFFSALAVIANLAAYELGKEGVEAVVARFPKIKPEQLQRAAKFIHERIEAGDGVYIHCAAGVGRAPLVGAAYLVTEGYSPQEAMKLIRSRRPFVNQSGSQKARLEQFAAWFEESKKNSESFSQKE